MDVEPGDKPEVEFRVTAGEATARAYCNVHGLWRSGPWELLSQEGAQLFVEQGHEPGEPLARPAGLHLIHRASVHSLMASGHGILPGHVIKA